MNYSIFMFISMLCIGTKGDENGNYYTEKDFTVIELLAEYFHSPYLVFVENGAHVNFFKKCQDFLGVRYYCAAFNSSVLEKILKNDTLQAHFFQKRSVIITKEKLNLTELMDRVLLPYYLTWIIFRGNERSETFYIPASCNVFFVNSTNESVERVYHLKRGYEAVTTSYSLKVPNSIGELPSGKEKTFDFQPGKINYRNISLNLQILHEEEACKQEQGEIMKKLSCIHQVLLMLIGIRLNYSVNFVHCKDREHPYTYPNGTDSELFIKLKNREVDFSSAVTHVAKRGPRRPFVDYVWPTFVLKTMMYLGPTRVTGRWASYLKPLEPPVWWSILGSITVTGILMKISEKLLAGSLKFDSSFAYELIMSTFRALQVFCNQAVVDLSTSYSIRIIYVLKFFIVLIFFQAYCGYLVSSLTVVIPRFPFTDLKGFLDNQQYRVMTLRKGFHRYYFRKIILDGYDENLMLPDDVLPQTIQDAVNRLCAEDYLAFSGFREDVLNFGSLSCKISELPSPLVHTYFGIGIPKKTPLKEYLKREFLHFRSTGIIRRMESRLSAHSDFRDSSTSEEYSRVSIMHVFSIFILLDLGIGLSLIIFCLEIVMKKTRSRISRRRGNSELTLKE